MFTTFAHAGHDHTDTETTVQSAEMKLRTVDVVTEQHDDFLTLPIITGGVGIALVGVIIVCIVAYKSKTSSRTYKK